MPSFQYVAFDKAKNRKVEGELDGISASQIRTDLQERGLYVIRLEEKVVQKASGFRFPKIFSGVSHSELQTFYKSLTLSIKAGVSLGQVFECLVAQTGSANFKEILIDVHGGITKGRALSECFRKFPKVFPDQFISMIEAGEASGKLAEVMIEYCEYVDANRKMKGEIIGSLVYPLVIIAVAIVAVLILTLHIFPTFMKSIGLPKNELPWITQVVYDFSTLMIENWLYILLGCGATFFSVSYFVTKVPVGIRIFHWLQVNTPFFKDLFIKMNLSQFSRTMALQSRSGVASVQSLQLTERAMQNIYYKELVADIIDTIRKGGTYLDAMKKRPKLITPLVVLLVSVGEQTGTFDEVLDTIADYYSDEVRTTIKGLTSMIEPLMIVIMGVVVGVIAASMFLPMFDLVDKMQ